MNEVKQIKKNLLNKQKQYQLQTLAKKLNVSVAYISMLLNGKRKSKEMLAKIKDILTELDYASN